MTKVITTDSTDYLAMIEAANKWGPETDPDRRWFLAGWRDQADGAPSTNKPEGNFLSNMGPWAAYNSGIVAAREPNGIPETVH